MEGVWKAVEGVWKAVEGVRKAVEGVWKAGSMVMTLVRFKIIFRNNSARSEVNMNTFVKANIRCAVYVRFKI